ncbi:MAG: hypothetical protein LEGION0398_MBIBDBAK_00128 [Legionellaceae bacterium]
MRAKILIKKFIVATNFLAASLQIAYAELLILLTQNEAYGIQFASIAEVFFWPESVAFLEIAIINVSAFLFSDKTYINKNKQ